MPRPKLSPEPMERSELRLPLAIKERIKTLAQQNGLSFNQQALALLKDALNRTRIKRGS